MPVVETQDLTKDFHVGFFRKKPVRALDGLNLTVGEHEIFGFLGPNGAGKTTAIKLLVGLLFPTSGSGRILGAPLADVEAHRRIGYLPEQAYFYDYLTARELVEYYGRLSGLSSAGLRRRTADILERVGLEPDAFDRQLRKFSKGMLQRVGLAQALVHDPEVVFLDEPMSGLDPIGRRHVRDLILELRSAGRTVFFSSHILADVEALCDRVAILNRGKLVESGRLDEIRAQWSGELEIVVTGVSDEAVAVLTARGFNALVSPGGASLRVANESEIDGALSAIRSIGGRVATITPTRSSLEDLFIREVTTAPTP